MTNNDVYSWIVAALSIGVLMMIAVLITRMIAPGITDKNFKSTACGFVFAVVLLALDIYLLLTWP